VFIFHSVRSSGARLGGTIAHGEPSLDIPLMIFMTNQEPKQLGVKVEIELILMQDLLYTWNGSEQWDITHHQCAVFLKTQVPNVRLRPSECSMNIIKPNVPKGLHLLSPFSGTLPGYFYWGVHTENWAFFFKLWPKLVPKPSEAHLWHFQFWWEAPQVHRVSMMSLDVFRA